MLFINFSGCNLITKTLVRSKRNGNTCTVGLTTGENLKTWDLFVHASLLALEPGHVCHNSVSPSDGFANGFALRVAPPC